MLLLRTSRGVDPGIPLLRSLGSNAHVWLPGANGVSVASLPSNNYLLSDGSTGYSTVDGVDGLTLDGMGALGSERVTNGTFDSDTAWTKAASWSIAGGVAANDGTNGGVVAYLNQAGVVAAGRTYIITFDLTRTSGSINLYLNASQLVFAGLNASGSKQYVITSTVTGSLYFEATASAVVSLDNISVKEYTGIHLTQATTANKPLVRRGMLNLLLQSATLSNASWLKARCTFPVDKIIEDNATGSHAVYQSYATVVGQTYTLVFSLKAAERTVAYISFDGGVSLTAYFNLATGVVGNIGGGVTTSSIASQGNGVYLCTITCSAAAGSNVQVGPGTAMGTNSYLGDSTSGIYVYGGLLAPGTWTAAQILAEGGIPTTTATAASNPSAGKYWWSFDGSNDSLLSGNLGITNACTIVIAGRVNSLATVQTLLAEDANGVQIYIDTSGIVTLVKFGVSLIVNTAAATIVAGVPFVVTVRLSGGTAVIRKNGVQVATAATALAFSATTGARIGTNFDGTTQPAGGALGWVVPLPVALSDADCLTVERLVGQQFPGMSTVDGDANSMLLEDGSGFLTMETGDLLLLE